jgi:hypothetical protein
VNEELSVAAAAAGRGDFAPARRIVIATMIALGNPPSVLESHCSEVVEPA